MVVFRQSGCIKAKVVVFEQSGCIRAKVVLFGQSGRNLGENGFIRAKWLYSGKSG